MIILKLLGMMCLTVLLVNATPILYIRDKMGLLEMSDTYPQWKNRAIELLSCPMCLGLWVGVIFLIQKEWVVLILLSCIVSIGSELINKILRK